jgi:hypothetical protein
MYKNYVFVIHLGPRVTCTMRPAPRTSYLVPHAPYPVPRTSHLVPRTCSWFKLQIGSPRLNFFSPT